MAGLLVAAVSGVGVTASSPGGSDRSPDERRGTPTVKKAAGAQLGSAGVAPAPGHRFAGRDGKRFDAADPDYRAEVSPAGLSFRLRAEPGVDGFEPTPSLSLAVTSGAGAWATEGNRASSRSGPVSRKS